MQIAVNYIAVIVAAVAGFFLGWGWYAVFGEIWKEGLGRKKEDCEGPMPIVPLVIAGVSCFLMAWMLAGLMAHLSDITIRGGVISGFFVWLGFVITTMGVNHAFSGAKPMLTLIDGGYWLAVLLIQGAVIGAFGV